MSKEVQKRIYQKKFKSDTNIPTLQLNERILSSKTWEEMHVGHKMQIIKIVRNVHVIET